MPKHTLKKHLQNIQGPIMYGMLTDLILTLSLILPRAFGDG